jgi:acid phosphatase family membrane protein YuiD
LFLSIDCVFLFLIRGLECRGFADSIFGMSVVFASIVMYDAQVWLFCLLFLC